MRFGKVRVTAAFALAFALFYFFDESGAFASSAAAAAVHEAAHLAAVRLLGGKLYEIEFTVCGACIRHSLEDRGQRDALVAAAGPAANLLCMVLFHRSGEFGRLFAASSLLLAAYNLLPAYPLDGWRILKNFIRREKIAECISLISACGLLLLGAAFFLSGGSLSLFISGAVLALSQSVMYNNRT